MKPIIHAKSSAKKYGGTDVISTIPDDFMKDLFGDHCLVTVYKNGNIEVEEYDHD